MKRAPKLVARAVAATAGVYAGYVVLTYLRFGRASRRADGNPLLDRLMPEHDVRERHSVRVSAPAGVTFATARDIAFHDSLIVRGIFALRALPGRLCGTPATRVERRPIFDEVIALGWRQLADDAGRQSIMGAVTQPWRQHVKFHGLPTEEFVAFREPGYAKIAWTIEVEPTGPSSSVFSTETRVVTTDPISRERFRRYWAFLSPGILIIRYETLRLVRAEAERRSARQSGPDRLASTRPDP